LEKRLILFGWCRAVKATNGSPAGARVPAVLHRCVDGAVASEFSGLPDNPPPLELQISEPEVLSRRLTDAGPREVRVEDAEAPAFRSGREMWDLLTYETPIASADTGMKARTCSGSFRAQEIEEAMNGLFGSLLREEVAG
jgi:hypothetical protein